MMQWFKKLFSSEPTNQWIADVSVAGLQHYRGNDLAELIKTGDTLELRLQPDNQFDENAVMVMWHDNKLGYIPKNLATEVSQKIRSGRQLQATIIEIKPIRFGRKWIKIRIELPVTG